MAKEIWEIAVNKHANVASFPATGNVDELYFDESSQSEDHPGDLYKWDGSIYSIVGGPRPHPHH